jgi:hypothetical protein
MHVIRYSFETSPSAASASASHLNRAISTITSPSFSRVTILYQPRDLPHMTYTQLGPPEVSHFQRWILACDNHLVFEKLRSIQEIRGFKVVLCAVIWGPLADCAMRELERVVETEWVEGRKENMCSRPLVTCRPREFLPALYPGPVDGKFQRPWAPVQ